MAKVILALTLLLVIQAVNSYILLTANIDDLKNIGKQMVQSTITGRVGTIMRRAYNSLYSNKGIMKADDNDIVLAYQPEDPSRRRGVSNERESPVESDSESFAALGGKASVYLNKIKKIFENARRNADD